MIHFLILPGIFLHEFSHFIVGLILGAKPVKFSIIPNKANNSAGEVHFKNIRFFNAFPTAFAPIIGGLLGVYVVYEYYFLYENDALMKFAYVYLMVIFARTALPSGQDVKVAFLYPLGALMYLSIVFLSLEYYKIIDFINLELL